MQNVLEIQACLSFCVTYFKIWFVKVRAKAFICIWPAKFCSFTTLWQVWEQRCEQVSQVQGTGVNIITETIVRPDVAREIWLPFVWSFNWCAKSNGKVSEQNFCQLLYFYGFETVSIDCILFMLLIYLFFGFELQYCFVFSRSFSTPLESIVMQESLKLESHMLL